MFCAFGQFQISSTCQCVVIQGARDGRVNIGYNRRLSCSLGKNPNISFLSCSSRSREFFWAAGAGVETSRLIIGKKQFFLEGWPSQIGTTEIPTLNLKRSRTLTMFQLAMFLDYLMLLSREEGRMLLSWHTWNSLRREWDVVISFTGTQTSSTSVVNTLKSLFRRKTSSWASKRTRG